MAEASDHHRPGEPPPIRDEAADTPLWLPAVGLCLLLFGAFFVIWQSSTSDDESTVEAPAAVQDEAQGEAAAAPADEAPAEPAPAE